jgi:Flp pilus assembly pilin Flp
MIYMLMGCAHAMLVCRMEAIRTLARGERGQGTVEYVGLILLVSLLMVGMVAAMKGFNRSLSKGGYYQASGLQIPTPGSKGPRQMLAIGRSAVLELRPYQWATTRGIVGIQKICC